MFWTAWIETITLRMYQVEYMNAMMDVNVVKSVAIVSHKKASQVIWKESFMEVIKEGGHCIHGSSFQPGFGFLATSRIVCKNIICKELVFNFLL